MRSRSPFVFAAAGLLLAVACTRDNGTLGPAPFPDEPAIFLDGFSPGLGFQAFGGSKLDALVLDPTVKRSGSASLKVIVPGPGDPTGGYAGGAFVANVPRDLTGYDAITFWARASIPAVLNVAGIGNDNSGNSQFTAERTGIALTTSWTKYAIAIPLASKLTQERGMFFFAEGAENNNAYEFWLDDIQYESLGTVINPRPTVAATTVSAEIGATYQVAGTALTVNVEGADQTLNVAPAYFTFTSSDTTVATVSATGVVTARTAGNAGISARLGTVAAAGAVTVSASAPPSVAAPTPTRLPADVISLFSDAYTNRTVDTWSAVWDQADVSDVQLAGNLTKRYSNLNFAGIEFTAQQIDASAMTHLHLDVYAANVTSFRVKLVDFGANGAFQGGDDSEFEITLSGSSVPALTAGAWSSLDIPLSLFTGLTNRAHLAQMIIGGSSPTTYIDNVYFYTVPIPSAPPAPAATPTTAAANVISLFSNAYTNVPVDTWSAVWDDADVTDIQIGGDDVKRYTNFTFAGIEFGSAPIDATAMTTFHFDYWTPNPVSATEDLKVKLVDFGANGVFGGGDDVEHELTFNTTSMPALAQGSWVRFAIPLSSFTGLTTRGHLAQLIFVSGPNTVFFDNIYFSSGAALTTPATPAPTPTYAAGDVIALFSNPYTNSAVDTWSAPWDAADVDDVMVGGNATKRYTNLTFAGIEFTTTRINATAMTHFRMDVWTPDPVTAPAVLKVKLVDFGANGAFGGGDDVEHELTFSTASSPALSRSNWVTLDIPFSAFTGLTTRANVAQLIIVGEDALNTIFIDNVLFRR
ncbi:Ig-like domain-containing protein [Luteitalea sp.]|uniref:Ig-like domain-containing protein n=1 Tax=Luteitalea sp. TaxID=2004800 RepID=UPI0025C30C2E|nr:Ig-like domain-containing protein [Luteitalea sp.]